MAPTQNTTIHVLKNGERVQVLPGPHHKLVRGRIWGKSSDLGWVPLLSRAACEAEGVEPRALAAQAGDWDEANDRFVVAMGENPFGIEVLTDAEWSERERARWEAEAKERGPEVHRCERCGEKIEGEPVWRESKFRGLPVHDPLCRPCASILRVFAGGIGVDGEPFEPEEDDRTPYTKEDY